MCDKRLHSSGKFLLFQCSDVAKLGYVIALFISHSLQPVAWLFTFICSYPCSRNLHVRPQRIVLREWRAT